MQSPKFSLNTVDWKKLGIHLAIIAVGAILTSLIQYFSSYNFGTAQPFMAAVLIFAGEIVQKYFAGK